MRIATLNIHEFTDNHALDSRKKLAEFLNKRNPEVICLQEVSSLSDLSNFIDTIYYRDYTGKNTKTTKNKPITIKYNFIYNRNTAILSIYPIQSKLMKKTIVRYTHGLIISNQLNINIICVHLNYKDEEVRQEELFKIMRDNYNKINNEPTIVLGDFNALTRSDYSDKEWRHIAKLRRFSKWEPPVYDLTDSIKCKYNFIDTREICYMKTGENGTSRFDTRIDYIYINEIMYDKLENSRNNAEKRCATNRNNDRKKKIMSNHDYAQDGITDHNMVYIEF